MNEHNHVPNSATSGNVCPACGHCPTCGRKNDNFQIKIWPNQPWHHQPHYVGDPVPGAPGTYTVS